MPKLNFDIEDSVYIWSLRPKALYKKQAISTLVNEALKVSLYEKYKKFNRGARNSVKGLMGAGNLLSYFKRWIVLKLFSLKV